MHELVVWDLSRIGVLWHPKKTVAGKSRTFASFKLLLMYLLLVIFFFNDVAISESENLEFAPT